MKNEDDEEALENFFAADRHYLILTNAGKPVYSMVGDVYTLAPIFATLYAIVSKAQTYCFKEDVTDEQKTATAEGPETFLRQSQPGGGEGPNQLGFAGRDSTLFGSSDIDFGLDDESKNSLIQSIQCTKGDHYKFAFVTKANCLIYIGLSRNKHESISFVKKQLEMLHL